MNLSDLRRHQVGLLVDSLKVLAAREQFLFFHMIMQVSG